MALTPEQQEALVDRLRDQKAKLPGRRAEIRRQIEAEYKERIEADVTREVEALELDFAISLGAAVERGLPLRVIQRDVLRTTTWSAWTKWRDLAGMDNVRVVRNRQKYETEGAENG